MPARSRDLQRAIPWILPDPAAAVDVFPDLPPLGDHAARFGIERDAVLAEIAPRWAERPRWWRTRWRRILVDLRPLIAEHARRHRVALEHVEAVALAVSTYSSGTGKPVWPKVARIQERAGGLSRRVVFRALAVLRVLGLVDTIAQILVRPVDAAGVLIPGPCVRLLTMPTAALQEVREALDAMRAEEVDRRRRWRLQEAARREAAAARVVDEILARPAPSPAGVDVDLNEGRSEPPGAPEAITADEVTARGLAAARASLAASTGRT